MTEKQKADPLRYIVVSAHGDVYGTAGTKVQVRKLLADKKPIKAYIAEVREDGGYDKVATYSVVMGDPGKFTF